jgi:hypothetical protein
LRLALGQRFTGHLYQTLCDGKFVHLEWLGMRQYTRAGPSSPLLVTPYDRGSPLLGPHNHSNLRRTL